MYAIEESKDVNRGQLKYFGANLNPVERNKAKLQITGLLDTMIDAKEYGSILSVENYEWELLHLFVESIESDGQMTLDTIGIDQTQYKLASLVEIVKILSHKYDVVVTNPPYMSSKSMSSKLLKYVTGNYPDTKFDLFSVFIEKGLKTVKSNGFSCMVTMQSWMFLSSFEKMRKQLLMSNTIDNLLHMGNAVMGIAFGTAVSTIRKNHILGYNAHFTYVENKDIDESGTPYIFPIESERNVVSKADAFVRIPAMPIAYWATDAMLQNFVDYPAIGKIYDLKQGLITANNERFLRQWSEVDFNKFIFDAQSVDEFVEKKGKWLPYNKGGKYRKWYGNNEFVVNWENAGFEIRNYRDKSGKLLSRPQNIQYFTKEGASWSIITNGNFSLRYTPVGFGFDARGSMMFSNSYDIKYALALMCSNVAKAYLDFLSPTVSFEVGSISKVPFIYSKENAERIVSLSTKNIELVKEDWDSFETSWNFQMHPFVKAARFYARNGEHMTIAQAYEDWKAVTERRFDTLKHNEEMLNKLFIKIYSMDNDIDASVEEKDISIRKAQLNRDVQSLISYAVGCMFGRYSLDEPGIIYAGGKWNQDRYNIFIPDSDNCIPVTDEEYLEDDIVGRFCDWIKTVFSEDCFEENLEYIANALGNKGATSREVIRNYFLNDFFKNHCAMYSGTVGKRPIYWLFDSGKQNGFKALVYMHRWNADTVGNLRVEYLHKMQHTYEREIVRMQEIIDNSCDSREVSKATKRKDKLQKQLKETKDYDAMLAHIALARIEIDLDDGVKVNYEKVQTGRDGKKMQILAKI